MKYTLLLAYRFQCLKANHFHQLCSFCVWARRTIIGNTVFHYLVYVSNELFAAQVLVFLDVLTIQKQQAC